MSIRGDAARHARDVAFSAFFAAHWSVVRRRVEALLEDEDAADDVDELVNDVFLLAWKKWDGPRGITLKWLHVVIDNELRDRHRRQRVRARVMNVVQRALVPAASELDELDRNVLMAGRPCTGVVGEGICG